MSEATELTKNEQSLINKLEEETKNTSGGLPSYVATISENVGSAIELNNELSKRYGNTPISLHDLRKAGNFKNIMCSSSILGSALGMFPSTIEFNDALTSDIKNSRIDDTARVGLKVVVGIGIGAILLPYAAGAATVGVAAVGSAMVGYLSALAGNIIDESWEAGKDYLKDLWSQLETRLNDFRNTLSPELQTVFDQCANPVFEGLQVCPTSLNALQTVLQNNYSDELNKAANNLGLNQCPLPQNKMDKIDELMDTAEKTKSPLIVDLDGDGKEDKVRVEDNGDSDDLAKDGTRLIANVNGVDTAIKDYEGYVYSSRITTGDLSGDGKADVLLKRYIFGSNYGATEIYILHLEDSGWVEYPYNFIHNPNIDLEQPDKFGDVEYWWDIESYIGATLFEKDGKTMVRFISLQYEVDDENTVKCTEVSYRKDGWYIEDIRLIDNYYDKREELLAPWEG